MIIPPARSALSRRAEQLLPASVRDGVTGDVVGGIDAPFAEYARPRQ